MDVPLTQSVQVRTDAELAYMAGIIDGEGTIGIYRSTSKSGKNSFQVWVIVVQKNPIIIDWMKERFGGPRLFRMVRNRTFFSVNGPSKKIYQTYRWYLMGKKAGDLLKKVRPFLVLKGKKADLGIALADSLLEGGKEWKYPAGSQRSHTGKSGRPIFKSPELIAYQESLCRQCSQLNSPPSS